MKLYVMMKSGSNLNHASSRIYSKHWMYELNQLSNYSTKDVIHFSLSVVVVVVVVVVVIVAVVVVGEWRRSRTPLARSALHTLH